MVEVDAAVERSRRRNPIQWHGSSPRSGFTQIPNSLVRDNTLSAHARCVAALLFSHKARFEVSAVSLASAMGCSRPTATKALKELQDRGWLFIQNKFTSRGTRAFSVYHLNRSRPFRDEELAALRAGETSLPQAEPARASVRASATAVHPTPKDVIASTAGQAERLVNCCLSATPQKVRSPLIAPVQALLDEGQSRALTAAALIEWQTRSGSQPGLLPYLVSDAIKERNAQGFAAVSKARTTWDMADLREFGYRWNAPDVPDGTRSVDQVRAFMRQRKSEWLDEVCADIERKWQRALVNRVLTANPGVEESVVAEVLFSEVSTG